MVGNAGWISPRTDAKALFRLFTGSWMSLLLLAIPFALAAHLAHWGAIAVFVLVRPLHSSPLSPYHRLLTGGQWSTTGLKGGMQNRAETCILRKEKVMALLAGHAWSGWKGIEVMGQ